ncbi:MAG: small multi-drug export protein [Sulfolobales archaeon]
MAWDPWWELLYRVSVVAAVAASPVGEILVAIPVGVALGLDPFIAWLVSIPSNMAPSAAILRFLEWFTRRFPRFSRYFGGRGSRLIARLGFRRLSLVLVVATPFAGVYAVSLASGFLGLGRRFSFICQLLGVSLFGFVEALLIRFGLSLFSL